jgi:putative nucleotidyltransferase with HDIG domain
MIGDARDVPARPLPVGRIRPRAFAERGEPPAEDVARLASSIRKHGLLHPILVRPAGRVFEIVCGQRRWLACRSLGWGEIPAVVRDLDDRRALEMVLAENTRREGLSTSDREAFRAKLAQLFPGRSASDLEGWLGPWTPAAGEALPNWIETLPDTAPQEAPSGDLPEPPPEPDPVVAPPSLDDSSILIAPLGMTVRKASLVTRVKTLLNKLAKSGVLDNALLQEVVDDLLSRLEKEPLPDFMDLRYPPRTKRYLTRHCVNVAKLAVFLARAIGLPREELEMVAICGILHDVGMMRVKDEVFTKHAALDQAEWEQVKGHPIEGALLLTKEVVLRDVVARVALEHHERADGSGYPAGKTKHETHLYARIINVVDAYGAMVSPRAHRLPHLPFDAMRIVMDSGAKGMLDWELVNSFVRALSIYPVGSYVQLEGGEIARVIRAQPEIPEKPVIAIVADAARTILSDPVEIDLAMTEPMPKITPIPAPA